MTATEHAHIVQPDEVMAYLDGELDPRRASAVGAHIGACKTCQAVADDMRRVSQSLTHWHIGDPPRGLAAPAGSVVVRSTTAGDLLRPFIAAHTQLAAAAALFVVVGGLWLMNGLRFARSEAGPAVAAPQAPVTAGRPFGGGAGAKDVPESSHSMPNRLVAQELRQGQGTVSTRSTGPRISRTVQLSIIATEFDAVKPTIERILRDVSGFVGHIQASDPKVSVQSVQATLRIPAARLDEALAALRQLGHVADEIQSGEDLADQMTDVAARLANARNTEKRLNEILANRTGNVQSVLEVEREIARVRAEIESLDAQRVKLDDRVAYATVTLRVSEERRATLDSGPFPLSSRLRNALIDGLREASDSVIETALWTLRAGPVLLIWGAVIWFAARLVVRRVKLAKL
jgi:uncharacterized small protein (DUF1192 family)